jgi:very-short-patch-repair endonuclease/predicted transcriptional regulator of viral defense system
VKRDPSAVAAPRRKVLDMRAGFVEKSLAELAARQHGVVARPQLMALGLRPAAITRRLAAGRLHPVHAGVYAVGHPVLGVHGRFTAAVLACGRGAALGYASAAVLWNLQRTSSGPAHVVVPVAGGRRRAGVRVHRHPGLTPGEVTTRAGIPVTTPARTLLDLAATVPDRQLKHALDQAEIQELTDYPALDALARAHARHRGATRLRKLLDTYEAGTARTRSGLEIALLELCERHGLPRPLVNEEIVTGLTVDFVFAAERVAVEADSWQWHRGRAAFERDRERDAILATEGYRALRFTDRQIENDPATVARALRAALDARAA